MIATKVLSSKLQKEMEQGNRAQGCENQEKQRDNRVDWCNPLYSGTKGSNSS